ncbi:MAG: hypothetical protein ABWZ82_01900 [Candidatus Limnocylindrales bacterium]
MPEVAGGRAATSWRRLRADPYAALRRVGDECRSRGNESSTAAATISDGFLLLWVEQGLGPEPTVEGYPAEQANDAVSRAASQVRASGDYAAVRGFDIFGVMAGAASAVASIGAELLLGPDASDDQHVQVASALGVKLNLLEWAAVAVVVLDNVLGEGQVPALVGLMATDALRRARRELMSTGILGIADILLYQRNGHAIRRYVTGALRRARATETHLQAAGQSEGRVVALGNSLGGIILADTLAGSAGGDCDAFVTMGSQPGALKVLGALGKAASARAFEPWINIYDPRDFMGFKVTGLWPDATRLEDVEVDLGRGFPHSHGKSYYEPGSPAIRVMLERLGPLAVDQAARGH